MSDTKFRLFTSNSLEELANEYSRNRLKNKQNFRLDNFFAEEKICVSTQGMGTWMEHELVKKGHVLANVKFVFIRDAIDNILERFKRRDATYRPELFQEDVLIWRIYSIFADDKAVYDLGLESYLDAEVDEGSRDVRRYQLAYKLAQLYYDYMAFVPEKLHPELNNNLNPIKDEYKWQIALWKRLCLDENGKKVTSPAEAILQFISRETSLDAKLYEPMTFFGISAMAPYFLLVLKKLATVQPVNFFYLNHCSELWDTNRASWEHKNNDDFLDGQFENTLLSNFGIQGREFFKAVMDVGDEIRQYDLFTPVDKASFINRRTQRTGKISLLKDVQTRILTNTDDTVHETTLPNDKDDSLTIHSCFNEVREVEALQDSLLRLIQEYETDRNGEKITMNDIIVMAPDISKFAPTINAVFGNGPLKSKFCISDRSVKDANLMAETLLSIMSLCKGKFEITRISRLLDSPPLRKRFDFDDDNVPMLRDWLRKAGIRWGRSKQDREEIGAFEEYSWQYGMDRLLLKLALDALDSDNNEMIGYAGLIPVDFGTGQESLQLLNGLFRFYGELVSFVDSVRQGGRSGAEWCDFLIEERSHFFQADSESMHEFTLIGKTFAAMKEAMEIAGCDRMQIPYDVILSAVSTQLDTPAKGEPFLNGKITFCSLLPMRGIPCKIIALLGMDVGEFPRRNDGTSYNLVSLDKSGSLLKYYDRSRSIEDRFTFLEALMSAKDYFMVFYKGQDDQTLDKLVPAAPVSELVNYIVKIRGIIKMHDKEEEEPWPIVEHCLNSFDPNSFRCKVEYPLQKQYTGALLSAFSFDGEMGNVAEELCKKHESKKRWMWLDAYSLPVPKILPNNWVTVDEGEISIDLVDVINYLKEPSETFMTVRMGFPRKRWEKENLSDYETFKVDARRGNAIKHVLGIAQLDGASFQLVGKDELVTGLYDRVQKDCIMPVGGMAKVEFVKQQIDTWVTDDVFREEWRRQEQSENEKFELDLGTVSSILSDKYADWLSEKGVKMPPRLSFKIKLTGSFSYFDSDGSIGVRQCLFVKNIHGKHLIPLYMKHLMLCADKKRRSGKKVISKYMSDVGAKITEWDGFKARSVAADEECSIALEQLKRIAGIYILGNMYPLPLFGKASILWKDCKKELKPSEIDEVIDGENETALFGDWYDTSRDENMLKNFAEFCFTGI